MGTDQPSDPRPFAAWKLRAAKPATLRMVADAAGVSIGTVSNVLNHPEVVAPDTARIVQEQIARLGYLPSTAARSVRGRGAPDNVGLIVPDLGNELFVDIARGAQLAAPGLRLEVLLANSGRSWAGEGSNAARQADLIRAFGEARVRALLVGAMEDPAADLEAVGQYVRSVVVLNHSSPSPDWCMVLMDNEGIGRLAVEHLASVGVERLVFVSPPDVVQPITERRLGLRAAAARIGLPVHEVLASDVLPADGLQAATQLLSELRTDRRRGRVGVLAVTDDIALGVLQAVRADGSLRVPDDVAVIGMDAHHQHVASDWAPLTSFGPPGPEMGRTAMRLVRDELDSDIATPHRHRRVVVHARVLPRVSTIGPTVGG